MSAELTIREYRDGDWPDVWRIIEPVFRAGTTYGFDTEITADDARKLWTASPAIAFLAVDDAAGVVGTYFLRPNHQGPGGHVCNCGYIVVEEGRGRGVATQMCEHSQRQALKAGFLAMQYNFVASSNEGAVRLWQKLGFDVVGRLPGAFRHPERGFVDAYVMYKALADEAE